MNTLREAVREYLDMRRALGFETQGMRIEADRLRAE